MPLTTHPGPAVPRSIATAAALVEAAKQRWRAGTAPDAAGLVKSHPELLGHRSLVVDLAYEEFCLREEAGAPPDADGFAAGFPAFRSDIREVIRGHLWFADHPGLFAEPPEWPRPGETVEGCRILGEVGRGAFARVFVATDDQVGRHVVLKVAPAGSAEARAMGKIRHPNVVDVYWAKPVAGFFVICMPLLAVATIQDACDAAAVAMAGRRPPDSAGLVDAVRRAEGEFRTFLPPPPPPLLTGRESYADAVAAVAVRIADALAALHRAGVVHSDLKPSNILLAEGGTPYLIDFNLAAGPDVSALRCGGTLAYMPPERLRELLADGVSPSPPGPRTDVYAFGTILHQLLTGRLPFEPQPSTDVRAAAADLLAKRQGGAVTVQGPEPLAGVIARCLADDPADRPATAEELLSLLRADQPGRVRKVRRLTGAAIAAAVLVTALGGWAVSGRTGAAVDDFALGRECLARGRPTEAMNYFARASQGRKDGATLAHLSYCCSLVGNHTMAVDTATEAIGQGYDTPAVWNNRAYSRLKRSWNGGLTEAVTDLTEALRRAPDCRPAHYNMAVALFRRDYDQTRARLTNTGCMAHMNAALNGEPKSAQMYYEASLIYAAASHDEPALQFRALACCREAVRLGRNPIQLWNDPVLKAALGGSDEFAAFRSTPAVTAPSDPSPPLALADPAGG